MELPRVARLYVDIPVTATDRAGAAQTLTGVDVALVRPRATPDAATTWTPATWAGGRATVLLAGPSADPSGALPVPTEGADLWIRVVDTPEIVVAPVGRVAVI